MTLEEVKKLIGIQEDQIWLLKAALFDPEQAITYWERWKKHKNLNHITKAEANYSIFSGVDTESLRVLPLIYRNLEHSGDSLLPALRDAYRNTWMANQKLLYRAQEIVRACNEAGIPNMLLKGIPMSLHYYEDMGVRPMGDVDLLVPLEYLDRTVNLLQKYGNVPHSIENRYRHLIHALHCFDSEGVDVDLHWYVSHLQRDFQSNSLYVNESIRIDIGENNTGRILNPKHQLFHTIIHGFRWEGDSIDLRCLMDTWYILKENKFSENDWRDIFDMGGRYHLSISLKSILLFLAFEMKSAGLNISIPCLVNKIHISKRQILYLKISQAKFKVKLFDSIRIGFKTYLTYQIFHKYNLGITQRKWWLEKIRYRNEWRKVMKFVSYSIII